jgi:hypothetical protein
MKKFIIALMLGFIAHTTYAQSSVVDDVKHELIARSVDLSGPCGAFQITKRVAWRLRAQGAGYIRKNPGQNNCELHGVDIVMYRDGRIVDILSDSGISNGPTWDTSKAPVDPALWQEPQDPGDPVVEQPTDPGTPIVVQPAPINIQAILDAIRDVREAQERIFAAQAERDNQQDAAHTALARTVERTRRKPALP